MIHNPTNRPVLLECVCVCDLSSVPNLESTGRWLEILLLSSAQTLQGFGSTVKASSHAINHQGVYHHNRRVTLAGKDVNIDLHQHITHTHTNYVL